MKKTAITVLFLIVTTMHGAELTDLSRLNGAETVVLDRNLENALCGYYIDSEGKHHAFLYSDKTFTDITSFPESEAYAINAKGQVVGTFKYHPFHDSWGAFLFDNGIFTDIGAGYEEFGNVKVYAINDKGQIVGELTTYSWKGTRQSNDLSRHAFLWENGVFTDLNRYFPQSDNELISATGIDNFGRVTGEFLVNNEVHVFLLTP